MYCVVLGKQDDKHVHSVLEELHKRGVDSFVYDHQAAEGLSFYGNYGISSPYAQSHIERDNTIFERANLIWSRLKVDTPWASTANNRSDQFSYNQWIAFYDNILSTATCPVIDPIHFRKAHQNKILQLKTASELGISTPHSILTTRKADAVDFIKSHGDVIIKAIGDPNIRRQGDDGRSSGMRTSSIKLEDVEAADEQEFLLCPCFLQQEIKKDHELRIVAIDQDLYVFKINSQIYEHTKIDWRYGIEHMEFEWIEPVDRIRDFIMSYLSRFHLTTGSFDFIVDSEQNFWFLECNHDGQWADFDEITEGAIHRSFADHIYNMASP